METWETLFNRAMDCLDTIPSDVPEPPWTLGGGTVLMLHYAHRQSKDIDIFLGALKY
ncbi:MAG: nucleotidyl transferase AbiEii/AbiGii toxin family protein [Thermaerobacter sp.]|nr:nucleotidyl transferase AbiEii/AbiGii toxin family protein [Thermaerobacter sp.]